MGGYWCLKIFQVELRVETPLIITSQQLGNILRHSFDIIPGQSLRGSLLSYLYRNGEKQLVEEEVLNPKLVFHPLYPLVNGNESYPALPLTYKCKICGTVFLDKDALSKLLSEDNSEFNVPSYCPKKHPFTVRKVGGSILYKSNGTFKNFSITQHLVPLDSVGINKYFKSSEREMLYHYTAVEPGINFRGFVASENDEVFGMFQIKDGTTLTLFMGRGISRGLGKISVTFRDRSELFDKEKSRIKSYLEKYSNNLTFVAKAPIFQLEFGDKDIFSSLNLKIDYFGDINFLEKRTISSNNKHFLLTGVDTVSGFSLYSKLPKARIIAAKIGSMLFYRLNKVNESIIEFIAKLEFLGVPPFSYAGYNILEVLNDAWYGIS